MRRWPVYYTTEEGGEWQLWNPDWGYIDTRDLGIIGSDSWLLPFGPYRIVLNCTPEKDIPPRVVVHALRFESGVVWDCVNGWRPQ